MVFLERPGVSYGVLGCPVVIRCTRIGLDWIIGEVMARTVGSAGDKSFHPYQVGTFIDYPR